MSALVPRLELRQGQSMAMTLQLQQSIKLLQMSSQELVEFIEEELEKNPLLAVEEQDAEKPESDGTDTETKEPTEATEFSAEQEEGKGEPAAADDVNAKSTEDWSDTDGEENTYSGTSDGAYEPRIRTSSNNDSDESEGFESFAATQTSLRDHLLDQLRMETVDPIKRIIGQHLIDLVDESGYIKDDTSGIATLLDCPPELIEATFATLHSFDPSGVCARNLPECLAIQLRDKNRLDPAMETLLQHLDLMAKGEMATLAKLCGVDGDDLKDMCAEIRALNPRPGSGFQHEAVQSIVPDVFLRRAKGGGWQVELNSNALPRVLVNRRYYSQLSGKTRDKQERKYLSDQLAQANWLVKALDQRANTVLKVATEIVAQQDAFFRQGIRYLRPLTLKEVALAVGLHESTVSRVKSNKYMLSPRGTYELKYFFNASIGNALGDENYSNKTVQFLIKELVDQESPKEILSDDAIAAELKNRGVDVARRTVAKYRELMQIPSSPARKREKNKKG